MVLFGRPTTVYAEVDQRRDGAETDDDSFVALEHAGGERSHLWFNVTSRILGPRYRVSGLRGAYQKYGLDPQEDALDAGADPAAPWWGREPEDQWGTLADEHGERPIETEAGAYPAYYAGIVTALQDGSPPPVDPQDSITGLRVLEAARRSAASGTVEPFDA
jgi:predicted dehydrogenase